MGAEQPVNQRLRLPARTIVGPATRHGSAKSRAASTAYRAAGLTWATGVILSASASTTALGAALVVAVTGAWTTAGAVGLESGGCGCVDVVVGVEGVVVGPALGEESSVGLWEAHFGFFTSARRSAATDFAWALSAAPRGA